MLHDADVEPLRLSQSASGVPGIHRPLLMSGAPAEPLGVLPAPHWPAYLVAIVFAAFLMKLATASGWET